MIQVGFVEPDTPEWNAWKEEAEAATENLIQRVKAGDKPKIDNKLYKKMKDAIFEAYHGKCAYCEVRIAVDQPGDVEHFRPKNAVVDENDQPVRIEIEGQLVDHPGYYWLAYDWRNLLPSCAKCNRQMRAKSGRLEGKGTRFPLAQEAGRAREPDEEGEEDPLFIHPVFDDPAEHLTIDKTGVLGFKTAKGEACIKFLGLNRDALVEERRKVYRALEAHLAESLGAVHFGAMERFLENIELMNSYRKGEQAYSCAGRKALNDLAPKLEPLRLLFEVVQPG